MADNEFSAEVEADAKPDEVLSMSDHSFSYSFRKIIEVTDL
ncbi:hypothetical protein bcere0020_18810 [Bacillus cereus Rock3-29]|nr:hypothetical protein bcere0020_18810 [Bacillus cereus Rock3-29]